MTLATAMSVRAVVAYDNHYNVFNNTKILVFAKNNSSEVKRVIKHQLCTP